jgi:hypothetical protein
MTNFCEEYRQQLARSVSVLDSLAHADHDVELSLGIIYALEKVTEELETFLGDQGFDPDEKTYSALAGLRIFCRSTRLLLEMGLDPKQLRNRVDPSDEIKLFCQLCADAMRQALQDDEQPLKEAA